MGGLLRGCRSLLVHRSHPMPSWVFGIPYKDKALEEPLLGARSSHPEARHQEKPPAGTEDPEQSPVQLAALLTPRNQNLRAGEC